jgi:DMSO/TMAO reductase YedYZ molybdopterin-dependent catalytic subunit
MECACWRRTHYGVVWLVASILLMGCGGTLPVSTPQTDITLDVRGNVAASGTWDADRLQRLGLVGLVAIQPNGEEVTYEGVLLRDFLEAIEPAPGASRVIFSNLDGERVEMPLDSAQACEECLIAFGPWGSELRLAMPDQPAELWVNKLASIEIQ